MSRESIVFVVGFLVVIVPYLGVPEGWKAYFFTAVGVLLMVIGYSLRRATYLRSIQHKSGERRADSFVEHVNHPS
jgi:hypothetical protein